MKEKFNVNYLCGCVHEIEQNPDAEFMFMPTGNDTPCDKHKVVIEEEE